MYPGFIAEYDDQSDINKLPVTEVRNRALFGAVFTSDKGPEGWTKITGEDFFKVFGTNISFARHGQPLLQTAMAINAGAEMLCKRLVSDDATLANIGIVATLSDTEVQAVDADGNPLYIDGEGHETIEPTDTPSMAVGKSIKFSLKTAEGVTKIEDAYAAIIRDCGDNDYLLFVISDIGRGTSKKRIKLVPNYRLSKGQVYTLYTLYVLEGSAEDESMNIAINPSIIVKNQNISIESMINANSTQLACRENEAGFTAYVQALADAAGMTYEEMVQNDVMFGRTNRGDAIHGIVFDNTGIDLQYSYGQMLTSGSDGAFGSTPWSNQEEFSRQAIKALNGEFDHVIFNLDQFKLSAWVDANYPAPVKRAIEALAAFREDFFYFRDQGLGQNSLLLIENETWNEAHNMFCGTYPQSYDVLDPYTKKQITVTIGYSLAQLLVAHCDNGCILPTAGMKHSMIIKDAIYGTLSFTPTKCPDEDQKEKMEDMRANYASYIDNQLVLETLWTSNEKYSQWSFVNNVMGIQEVVKAIRTRCPAIRYSFIEGEDLTQYKADVEEVIAPFASNFRTLELEYKQDATYSANKIFYAVLKCIYKDFVQTEWFKVTALSSVEVRT